MYVSERFNSWICKRALNMRYPEATVMETFVIYDWCQFMAASGRMPPGFQSFNLDDDNILDETSDQKGSVFSKEGTLSRKESRSMHDICSKCEKRNCKVRRKYHYQLMHQGSGRKLTFSCTCRSTAQTISSYVFFEVNRGTSEGKLSPGKYIVF